MNGLEKIVQQNRAAAKAGIPSAPTLGVEPETHMVERVNHRTGAKVMVREPIEPDNTAQNAERN